MKILIDGDGCPCVEQLYNITLKYGIDFTVYYDYAHIVYDKAYPIKYLPIGNDSVDMMIVKDSSKGDLIVSQDYGLSALLLGKGCFVLHPNGKEITNESIDGLLFQRFESKKQRDQGIRTKHKKRSNDVNDLFIKEYEYLINKLR